MKLTIFKQIIPLAVVCSVLLGYQYMGAVWEEPGAGTLTETNTPAPIHTGTTTQFKTGGLAVDVMLVFGDMMIHGTSSLLVTNICSTDRSICGTVEEFLAGTSTTSPTGSGFNQQYFSTAGSDTFTVPSGVNSILVEVAGAGGGGGSAHGLDSGVDGSNSSFVGNGENIVGAGGTGGACSRNNAACVQAGSLNVTGSGADHYLAGKGAPGGDGGSSYFQSSQYAVAYDAQQGLSGGLAIKEIAVTPGQTYTVTVGSGGAGGADGSGPGAAGADGYVIVRW